MNAVKFVSSASSANETLPIGGVDVAALVDAELDLAGLRLAHRAARR